MLSFINTLLFKFYSFIDKRHLALNYCFDLSDKNDNMHWIDGNRKFFSSGKYINGKKHGEFRRYDVDGNPIAIEKFKDGDCQRSFTYLIGEESSPSCQS